jgi:hypothetical protein
MQVQLKVFGYDRRELSGDVSGRRSAGRFAGFLVFRNGFGALRACN